ncbi:transcriptional regulator [Campylobacter sputorum]|uniref:transcriptional regulator n=1 Tax=Campylobacter sputorum TaxID=206 RepID=UPI00053BDC1B|nr:transcriptional regulator [Campylobacter sputorum]
MTADELKAFCKENNLTYKELADRIGYGEGAIKTAVSTGNISQPMEHAIKTYKQVLELKDELKKANEAKEILKNWLNS